VAVGDWLATRARSATEHLEVDGRMIIEHGRLLTGNLDTIRAEAQQEAERLWKRL
jgi:hypothetical protein